MCFWDEDWLSVLWHLHFNEHFGDFRLVGHAEM